MQALSTAITADGSFVVEQLSEHLAHLVFRGLERPSPLWGCTVDASKRFEVKSSWVEAAGLPNLASYVTMSATIPTYDRSNPNTWPTTGGFVPVAVES